MVFQPLLMPTFLFALLFTLVPSIMGALPPELRWRLVLIIFLLTFGIPVVCLVVFRANRWISDLMLSKREERVKPFIFIVAFYAVSTYFLGTYLRPLPLLVDMIYLTMGLLVSTVIITFFWKISIHSAGIAAAAGFLWSLDHLYPDAGLYYPMLISFVLTGATMTARLQLRVHTLAQVTAGMLLGLAISMGGLLLLHG